MDDNDVDMNFNNNNNNNNYNSYWIKGENYTVTYDDFEEDINDI